MVRIERLAQVVVAIHVAVQARPLAGIGGEDRQVAAHRGGADQACGLAVEEHVGQDEHVRQAQRGPGEHGEKIVDDADRVVAVDQRGSKRSVGIGPAAHDGGSQTQCRPLHRIGQEKTQPRALVVLVAHDGKKDLPVLQPRHGGREETRIEEDIRLHGACGKMIEFVDQVETGGGGVDGQLARAVGQGRAAQGIQRDVGEIAADPGQIGDHLSGRGTAQFLDQGNGCHVSLSPLARSLERRRT